MKPEKFKFQVKPFQALVRKGRNGRDPEAAGRRANGRDRPSLRGAKAIPYQEVRKIVLCKFGIWFRIWIRNRAMGPVYHNIIGSLKRSFDKVALCNVNIGWTRTRPNHRLLQQLSSMTRREPIPWPAPNAARGPHSVVSTSISLNSLWAQRWTRSSRSGRVQTPQWLQVASHTTYDW